MQLRVLPVALLILALCCCGCAERHPYGPARLPSYHPPATNPHERIAASNASLGIKVLRELLREQPGKNVVISPLGLGLGLAMAYNGAAGETKAQIGHVLSVEGLSDEQVNAGYRDLRQAVTHADRRVRMDIANSLWLDEGWPFEASFVGLAGRYFDAQANTLDLQSPGAANQVNRWISERTRGTIPRIIDPSTLMKRSVVAVLLNAVYFRGTWSTRFDPDMAEPAPFKMLNGKEIDAWLMPQRGQYLYLETPQLQAISLPYASGRLSFYVFLPRETKGITDLCKSLSDSTWQQWMSQLAPREGVVNLPRFSVEPSLQLNSALKALGMPLAFGEADFSRMTRRFVFLTEVRHRTYLYVHEQGTEAAATTMAGAGPGRLMVPPGQFSMTIDHPFLCAIRDNGTGALLFMGTITDPSRP